MKYKKALALILTLCLTGSNLLSLTAFANDNKVIKTQVSQNQIEYINQQWWNSFNDEYLNSYIAKAIQNNHDLKIATLKVEEYRQLQKMQFSSQLPQIGAGFAPTGLKIPNQSNTSGMWAFPITVSYEIDLFLKNRDKTRSAKKDWEKAKLQERAAYISVASAVGTTYFNIVKADKIIELQKKIISHREQIYNLMLERNKVGLTSTADLVNANKAYIAAQADLYDLEKARATMLNSLAVLIGESANNANSLARAEYNDDYTVIIPDTIQSEIIDQRPDYLSAEIAVEKAGIDVNIAKKELLPKINLIGIASFASSALNTAFNWQNMLGVLGASAMVDIFTGGRKISALKIRKNQYEQILQHYYKTNLTAIQEVNDSLVVLKLDDKKYHTNLEVFKLEQKDFGYTKDKYNEGLISYLDLLQKEENLLALNKLVVANKLDCNINYIGLYKAVGAKL